jgi:Fe-S cluster assembly ATP-binding protein
MLLQLLELCAMIDGKPILKGVNLKIRAGEIHAIMGPNGAGKSTLAKVLAGDPSYETSGKILFEGDSIEDLEPEARARKGLFLGFQYPIEIPGITNFRFLHAAYNAIQKAKGNPPVSEEVMQALLEQKIEMLKVSKEFATRGLNQGFSGGEKKRNEILQMAVLEPKLAVLD